MSDFPATARESLGALLREPASGNLITSQHRKVIAQICDETRAAGMSVEALVVLLKEVLSQSPHEPQSFRSRAELRDRLVSICIEEYYRKGGRQ